MEEEIDLKKLVATPFRQWEVILSLTVVVGLIVGSYSVVSNGWRPDEYEASVLVASTKMWADVSLGSEIQIRAEDGADSQLDSQGRAARLESFALLAANPAVAERVLQDAEVTALLPDNEQNVANLVSMVEGSVLEGTDTIQIIARHTDPLVAATVANAWGDQYVHHINAVYAASNVGLSLPVVRQETERAKAAYDKAQADWLEFLTTDQRKNLDRRLAEKQAIISGLSSARSIAFSTVISETLVGEQTIIREYYKANTDNQLAALNNDLRRRQGLFNAYASALQQARLTIVNEQFQDRLAAYTSAYGQLRKVNQQLDRARNMRQEVRQGGTLAATTNMLALVFFKGEVYAPGGTGGLTLNEIPASLASQLSSVDEEAMLTDLEALIATLEDRQDALQAQVAAMPQTLMQTGDLESVDVPLGDQSSELAQLVQTRYLELFGTGALTALNLKVMQEGSPLATEAQSRALALLQLQGLKELTSYSTTDTPLEQQLVLLEEEQRKLVAQLEERRSRIQDLTHVRDLAWKTYDNLSIKQAELMIISQTSGAEVSLGAPAHVPTRPIPRDGVKRDLAIGIALGLVLGVLAAYVIELYQGYQGREPGQVRVFTRRARR